MSDKEYAFIDDFTYVLIYLGFIKSTDEGMKIDDMLEEFYQSQRKEP